MFNALFVLTRARLLIARNTFWRGSPRRKIGVIAMLALAGVLGFGINGIMQAAVSAITSLQFTALLERAANGQPELGLLTDVMPFLDALPGAALFAALVILIFTSFSSVLSSLYLSGDLDTLLVAPVPMRAVFIVKFFGGLIVPYVLLFFLLGPALIGYGQGLSFGPAFFVAVIVVLVLFPLLPAGLGALLVMVVVRVIPARRAREMVGVLGGLLGALWYIGSQFSAQIAPRLARVETLNALRQLNVPLLPSAWAGRALVAAGRGEWLTLLVYGGLFAALAIGVFAACLLVAERLYYAGWANIAAQGGRVKTKTRAQRTTAAAPGFVLSALFFVLPEPSRAILYKDLRVFPRDLRNIQQLIFPLVLAGIWTYRLITGGPASYSDRTPELLRALNTLGSVAISFFICQTISQVLGGPSISREGRGMWLLKVAPISAWGILRGKLVLAYLPFPLIGTLFVAVLSFLQQTTLAEFLRSLALVWLVGLGTTSISLGLGAAFPRLDWENPQQQQTFRGGCLSTILYMAYAAIALVVVLGIPALAIFAPAWAIAINIASWIICSALTATVVWWALSFGASRLEQLEIA